MKIKTTVGQILLTHPKDENFTSAYEESFSKHGQPVELFVVLDISGNDEKELMQRKQEYERLAQLIVATLKKTYISAPAIDRDTFERALAAINTALSKVMSKNRVNWYGKLNAAISALWQNELSISTTGNSLVYLVRKKEFTLLSEGLAEESGGPTKIFSNYSSGRVSSSDRVILSSKQIFNYLSLDRIRDFLVEETISDTCHEIINALQDIKTVGLSGFIFEIGNGGAQNAAETTTAAATQPFTQTTRAKTAGSTLQRLIFVGGKAIAQFAWNLLTAILVFLWRFAKNFLRNRPKKYIFIAIAAILALLVINVAVGRFQKSSQEKLEKSKTALTLAEEKLNEAEAALIYNDENRIIALAAEAKKLLDNLNADMVRGQYDALAARLQALQSKIAKEVTIDNPTVLTAFTSIPTNMYRSPDGFLVFNENSFSLSFYDFRSGQTSALLLNQNLSRLLVGAYLGGAHGYVFAANDGSFQKLDFEQGGRLTKYDPEIQIFDPKLTQIQALKVLGEGDGARIYLLDRGQNQILRSRAEGTFLTAAEAWLKTASANFADSRDIAVDNSIYVLFADRVEKYFQGQSQTFALSPVIPPLQNAQKIFTKADYQFLYILEPERERVLIFTKQGKLQNQLSSPKFRDLSDIYVDEQNKILYLLTGSELLQMTMP